MGYEPFVRARQVSITVKGRPFGVILHGYRRSSAACRVRIVLNLKQLSVEHAFHHLRKNGQRQPDYLRVNPQRLYPRWSWMAGAVCLSIYWRFASS
jgi:hypothetical protein